MPLSEKILGDVAYPRYGRAGLTRLVSAIFMAAGSSEHEADIVAAHLVEANLKGHDSHGVKMVSYYLDNLDKAGLHPDTMLESLNDAGPMLAFDGGLGYGQRLAREATDIAITRCGETGLALMTLRNAHHMGRIGSYGEQAAQAGYVSIQFVNVVGHDPTVAPFGGRSACYNTNPVCISVPGGARTPDLVLDFASSEIAFGKAEVAMNKGVELPPGCVLDATGAPSRDPNVLHDDPPGALLPFGVHKGSGLALMCELFGGALSGGETIAPKHVRRDITINNLFSLIVDPARMSGGNGLSGEVDQLVDYVKGIAPRDGVGDVMVAGEPERLAMLERSNNGIPLDPNTWAQVLASAERVGIARDEAVAFVS